MIVGFDYTITGHAYKCVDCSDNVTRFSKDSSLNIVIDDLEDIIWDLNNADRYQAWSIQDNFCRTSFSAGQYGVGNWRLPTKTELVSLVDNSSSPKILNTFLDDTYENSYWTGTVDENNSEKYYVVNFSDGSLTTKSKTLPSYVRCVMDNPNSTVDNHTYQEIFRGDTQHTVTEGTNSLNLRLSPLLDDRELTVPRITRIERPFQMTAGDNESIKVTVDLSLIHI